MRILMLVVYAILFYIIWKFIRIIIKYYLYNQNRSKVKDEKDASSKYRNIEDAKFTEIKDEEKDKQSN